MSTRTTGRRIILAMTLVAAVGLAAAGDRWLHVKVQGGSDDDNVAVNVPLSLVETLLPAIQTDEFRGGKIRMDDIDLEGIDLPEILRAIHDAPDADFVKVNNGEGTINVAKENGFLVVRADEKRGDRVRVKMPLSVIDAMLGGNAQEIDLLAGLQALADYDGEDLVTVNSDDVTVRVWIDSSESQ